MAGRRAGARKRHPIITAAWLLAAAAVVTGSVMRILASFWIGFGLRLLGVEFIAAGVVLAAAAWFAERVMGVQPPP